MVSPLISLMTDQVEQLQRKRLAAVALTSAMSHEELQEALTKIGTGKVKFLYVSPEKLHTKGFRQLTSSLKVSLVVVDEAHCISEWGHQFRPQYLLIREYVTQLPERPILAAFTASATPKTVQDISQQLLLNTPVFFRQSVYRPNLSLRVVPCPTLTVQLLVIRRLLKKYQQQAVIIYCATRRQTENVSAILSQSGFQAAAYHAGLESKQRQHIQTKFIANAIQIICATTAFGMGVDKPNIRCVIHTNLPASMEGYYQEVGRAGRDGQPSSCYVLFLPSDTQLQAEIIERGYPPNQATVCIVNFLSKQKLLAQKTVPLHQLSHVLSEQQLETDMKRVLQKGADQSWWNVDHARKQLTLLVSAKEIKQKVTQLLRQEVQQLQKLRQMKRFCDLKKCRQLQLLAYFEPVEKHSQLRSFRCGSCDCCQKNFDHRPSGDEQNYYAKLQRRLALIARHKKLPKFIGLATQLLASYQPADITQLAWMSTFGRGWQKEWRVITNKTDTADHP